MSTPTPTNPEREAMRAYLTGLVETASAAYPAYATRIVRAATLILQNDVTLRADGTARVASETNPALVYTVGSLCECSDFAHSAAPHRCKHTIARSFARQLFTKGLWVNPDGSIPGEDDAMAYDDGNIDDEYADDEALDNDFPAPPPDDRAARTARDSQRLPAAAPPHAPRTQVDVPIIAEILVKLRGRVITLKLCDTDDDTLIRRVMRLMDAYSIDDAPVLPPANKPPPDAPPPDEPTTGLTASQCSCAKHGQTKIRPSKFVPGGFYCAVKTDGVWCDAKWNP